MVSLLYGFYSMYDMAYCMVKEPCPYLQSEPFIEMDKTFWTYNIKETSTFGVFAFVVKT